MTAGKLFGIVFGVLLTASVAETACAAPGGRLYVRVGPPAPIVETRTATPGPEYVWMQGVYHWDGRAYVWEPGHWTRPPRDHARWVSGHWAHDRRGWFFVDGRWR